MPALHCLVEGKVQGVFFRQYTGECATRLDLDGWVRNLADGRVEVLAQGPRPQLLELLNCLQQGSPMSRVEKIEREWLEDESDLGRFEVRYR